MIPPAEETRPGSSKPSSKPSLEALLRVKRAERPDAAFWTDFERGLAQKQLAAIVEPRPWWLGLSLLGRRVGALGLPVSAAAAALLAVMVVRTESPLLVTQGAVEFAPVAAAQITKRAASEGSVDGTVTKNAGPVVASPLIESGPALAGESSADRLAPGIDAAALGGASEAGSVEMIGPAPVASEMAGAAFALGGSSSPSELAALSVQPAAEVRTASQLTIAQNLEAVASEAPDLVAAIAPTVSLASSLSMTESDLSAVAVTSRQARLLAMADMPELADADAGIAQVRERMVHRLDKEDSNYAEASRLGYGADRLSLRF
jgi:hypothetical protein